MRATFQQNRREGGLPEDQLFFLQDVPLRRSQVKLGEHRTTVSTRVAAHHEFLRELCLLWTRGHGVGRGLGTKYG